MYEQRERTNATRQNYENAMPPVMAPSPMTATQLFFGLLSTCLAADMPSAAEMDVEEWPVPKQSYSLSSLLVKPLMPCR